jgi:site-specific recombinase XerD
LRYLQRARPKVVNDKVFLTAIAPISPISRHVVSWAVASALRRAGVDSLRKGAQLLRHSAATNLLRDGASLPAISSLLRHSSVQTTTIYAKVDVDMLSELAMPWPEVLSC